MKVQSDKSWDRKKQKEPKQKPTLGGCPELLPPCMSPGDSPKMQGLEPAPQLTCLLCVLRFLSVKITFLSPFSS